MTGQLQPLVSNQRIVNQDGTPTEYFIRWAQAKQIDLQGAITAQQALEIATEYVADFMSDHPLTQGNGITLTPSGNIADGVTIAAEVQAILDQISTTHGTVLFRGAADWQALAPGTAGKFLKTNGPGADPEWATAGGGGGGALVKLGEAEALTSTSPSLTVSAIPPTSRDLIVMLDGKGAGGSGASDLGWRVNGDTGNNYNFQNQNRFGNTDGGGSNLARCGTIGGGTSPGGGLVQLIFGSYARTFFQKNCTFYSSGEFANGGGNQFWSMGVGFWMNTAAITSVTIIGSENFATGSILTVYGRG
jgi:hypothetical protein